MIIPAITASRMPDDGVDGEAVEECFDDKTVVAASIEISLDSNEKPDYPRRKP